jgi:CDP-paratose 2-epimerase
MSTVLVTGSAGLIGSESVRHFHANGRRVVGVDNDMRGRFFGPEASTAGMAERLSRTLKEYRHESIDIRDERGVDALVRSISTDLDLVIHAAAQPSHDWAAREPLTDFAVNAQGTLILLESVRRHAPEAVFIFTSSNKVYGDNPNRLPRVELQTRYELPEGHEWWQGVPESMPIDQSLHSLFGVSKASADLLVQEYGRYFGLRTATLRGGCLTGPGHAGTELHGFLAYLMKCTVTRAEYRVLGYKGKQVRDHIHSSDLVSAFERIAQSPRCGAVYNIGGGRNVNCSVLEAITLCEDIAERELKWKYEDANRIGDHLWWISDVTAFRADYPDWSPRYDLRGILEEIYEHNAERWRADRAGARVTRGRVA